MKIPMMSDDRYCNNCGEALNQCTCDLIPKNVCQECLSPPCHVTKF